MSQVIELNDEVFSKVKATAKTAGVSTEVWIESVIESRLSDLANADLIFEVSDDVTLNESIKDFIGAADRIPKPLLPRKRTQFGEILTNKYRKQGLKLDHDID